MRQIRIVVALMCIVAGSIGLASVSLAEPAASSPTTSPTDAEVTKLRSIQQTLTTQLAEARDEAARLSEENAKLQRKLLSLQRALARRQIEVVPQLPVVPQLGQPSVPKDWQPRKFNGQTYYIVPLKAGN